MPAFRALRMESLHQLGYTSCGSVRELVTGPGADIRNAFDMARRDIARYPSERAVVDLIERNGIGGTPSGAAMNAEGRFYDVVRIAETIYFNPRLGTCALRGATGGGRYY